MMVANKDVQEEHYLNLSLCIKYIVMPFGILSVSNASVLSKNTFCCCHC